MAAWAGPRMIATSTMSIRWMVIWARVASPRGTVKSQNPRGFAFASRLLAILDLGREPAGAAGPAAGRAWPTGPAAGCPELAPPGAARATAAWPERACAAAAWPSALTPVII